MIYLIIGASSGLGRALADKFAKEKKNLIIVSRDDRDLTAMKSDLEIKYNINVEKIKSLKDEGMGATAIARELGIHRDSVYRLLKTA